MAARQVQILAGSASAVTAVMLGLAGCAAASHATANDVPRPASQTAAAAGHASAGAAVRLASPLAKCAEPVAPGGAVGGAGSAPGTGGQARQPAALGGSAPPVPLATASRVAVRQMGAVNLSQPGLVVMCGPASVHCPLGFRALYRRALSGHRRPVLPYVAACIARFPAGTLPPKPRLSPVPLRTRPLHTMPPQAAGG
jgi:hypothetical protein